MEKSALKNLYPWLVDNLEPKVSFESHRDICNASIIPPEKGDNDDSFLQFLFAPDPLTGVPQSDLGLIVKGNLTRDVAEYISKRGIQASHPVQGHSDVPLDLIPDRRSQFGTERNDYINRLREIAKNGLAFKSSSNDNSKDT